MQGHQTMKRLGTSIAAAAIFLGGLMATSGLASAASSMSVKLLPSSGPTTLALNKVLTLRLKATGITLDASHIGKAPKNGVGHFQIYLDKIPKDAYAKKSLKSNWLAAVAAPVVPLKMAKGMVKPGKHKIIVALAKNNYVLYHVPTVSLTITIK
jgi:hypothetical protein